MKAFPERSPRGRHSHPAPSMSGSVVEPESNRISAASTVRPASTAIVMSGRPISVSRRTLGSSVGVRSVHVPSRQSNPGGHRTSAQAASAEHRPFSQAVPRGSRCRCSGRARRLHQQGRKCFLSSNGLRMDRLGTLHRSRLPFRAELSLAD